MMQGHLQEEEQGGSGMSCMMYERWPTDIQVDQQQSHPSTRGGVARAA